MRSCSIVAPGRGTGLDVVAVGLFLVTAGWIAARLVTAPFGAADIALLPAEFVVGYLAADLASGLVHWFCDSFFDEETPIIGHALIRPFREHHSAPVAMTRHGFLEVNGNNCLVLLFLLVPMAVLGGPATAGGEVPWLSFQVTGLAFALVTFATNQFHKWAHLPEPRPPTVRWLQATGLVLTPAHHARHHLPPHDAAFCVTAGWMNPLFDRLVRPRRGA
jgi:plasmanylethanolamine desaturase